MVIAPVVHGAAPALTPRLYMHHIDAAGSPGIREVASGTGLNAEQMKGQSPRMYDSTLT